MKPIKQFFGLTIILYFFRSNMIPANITKTTDRIVRTLRSTNSVKSNIAESLSMECFKASIPKVNGFIFAVHFNMSGRFFTGYMAPDRKNIGITIKFMIALKLSMLS